MAIEDDSRVSFRWKDYRATGRMKPKIMHLPASEFMRRFLLHVLPEGVPLIHCDAQIRLRLKAPHLFELRG